MTEHILTKQFPALTGDYVKDAAEMARLVKEHNLELHQSALALTTLGMNRVADKLWATVNLLEGFHAALFSLIHEIQETGRGS